MIWLSAVRCRRELQKNWERQSLFTGITRVTAQELEADTLASFDIRQRQLAASVGLKLFPALLQ